MSKKLNTIIDLTTSVRDQLGCTKAEARRAVEAVLNSINDLSEDKKLQLKGFGTFQMKTRAARNMIAPANGREYHIPPTRNLTFRPSKIAGRVV